jgi:probable HAF family extracellular repeat protein
MTDLGTLGGQYSYANDVNEAGQVVGVAQTSSGEGRGFLYSDGQMVDLTSLLPSNSGGELFGPIAINNRGQILVTGEPGAAYLLTPRNPSTPSAASSAPWTTPQP